MACANLFEPLQGPIVSLEDGNTQKCIKIANLSFLAKGRYVFLLPPQSDVDNSLSCVLQDVTKKKKKACMAAEVPSTVILHIPVAL